MKLAWHYTVGTHALSILRDGFIKPATEGVPAGEIPVVWFSARQHWEPTANKALGNDSGERIGLTMEETIRLGGGGWRFGLPTERLLYWRKLQVAARIPRGFARTLEKVGRESGADPTFWYGAIEPVAVKDCAIGFLRDGVWEPVDPARFIR